MRILVETALNYEEKTRDCFYGSIVYKSPEALLRRTIEDLQHEEGFDLENSGELDATEADEIRENYKEQRDLFVEFLNSTRVAGGPVMFDSGGRGTPDFPNQWDYYNENTGVTYHFEWQDLNE